jgi:hypothetical protein
MLATTSIPPPDPADTGEVTEALDVAGQLWRTGNRQDAIRWVRRAAQAADEAGDSQRMSVLARASTDLEASLTEAPVNGSSASPLNGATTPPPIRASKPPPLPARARSSLPPPPESASRMRAKTSPPPLMSKASRPAPTESTPPEGRTRYRVSIKTSALDPTLLVVRRLEEGMSLPVGTREGWLESTNIVAAHANGKSVR